MTAASSRLRKPVDSGGSTSNSVSSRPSSPLRRRAHLQRGRHAPVLVAWHHRQSSPHGRCTRRRSGVDAPSPCAWSTRVRGVCDMRVPRRRARFYRVAEGGHSAFSYDENRLRRCTLLVREFVAAPDYLGGERCMRISHKGAHRGRVSSTVPAYTRVECVYQFITYSPQSMADRWREEKARSREVVPHSTGSWSTTAAAVSRRRSRKYDNAPLPVTWRGVTAAFESS